MQTGFYTRLIIRDIRENNHGFCGNVSRHVICGNSDIDLFIAFVELIIGIILLVKKKKVPGIILLVLSAIPVVVTVVLLIIAYFTAEYPEYDTYDGGTVTINMEDVRIMENIIRAKDMEGLDEYLDKHPELIYYQDDNHQTLLEYGLHDFNVEIMQTAVDHGAVFDAEPTFRNLRYDHSLENFSMKNTGLLRWDMSRTRRRMLPEWQRKI